MYTKRTIENLAGLNKKFRVKVEALIAASEPILARYGATMEVISGVRSWAQQAALYAQGRTKPGKIVTKARPGSSWHNYGLAVDFGLFKGGKYLDDTNSRLADKIYAEIAIEAKKLGIEWAGDWKKFSETPHFQFTNGRTQAELLVQMNQNGYDVNKLIL